MKLTMEKAQALLATTTDEEHLIVHAFNVRGSMEAFARHFDQPPEEVEHWGAVGYLHDYDYQRFPSEHLAHTEVELRAEGVEEADIRAILSHGWMLVNDVTPQTDLEKSLYCADELSGLVWATALMRPSGISDLDPRSVVKKFKDKKFAAKCSRDVIRRSVELLRLELAEAIAICIDGMRPYAGETGLLPRPAADSEKHHLTQQERENMTIKYQGKETETSAANVAAFLEENGVAANEAVIELDGEIVAANAAAGTLLHNGAELNAFRIVSGG